MRLGDRAATEREMRTLSVALGGAPVALADAGGNPLGGVGPGSDEAGAAAPAADFAPLVRAVLRSAGGGGDDTAGAGDWRPGATHEIPLAGELPNQG